jgi:Domain of unknown function (DUF4389)
MEQSHSPEPPAEPPSSQASGPGAPYPLKYSVDYPDRPLNRLTTFFRVFVVIPIAIVLVLLEGGGAGYGTAALGGGLVVLPTLLMILFRQKYPRWWFHWNLELMRFSGRVGIFLALMDDRYPSTDEQQALHLDFPFPDAPAELNRWLPLVKWLLAIPHYVVLLGLSIAATVVVLVGFFTVLITGEYPQGLRDFLVGVYRYSLRVQAYVGLLTDQYPPFTLQAG